MNPQIKQTLILCSARLRLSSLFYAAEFSCPFSVSGSEQLFALTIQHAKIQHFLKFASICVIMWIFVEMAANIVVEIIARNSWQLMYFRKIVIILFILAKKCRIDLQISFFFCNFVAKNVVCVFRAARYARAHMY